MPETVILYVEDDPLSREVMRVLLQMGMGYPHVTIFEDSANFVAKLEALPLKPDLIFLDIHMEPIDGFAMLELIRTNPAYQNTKVIALTASVMNEEIKKLREVSFDGVVAKPLDVDRFPQILQRILAGDQIWNIK